MIGVVSLQEEEMEDAERDKEWGHREKATSCKLGWEASPEPDYASTLTLGFQAPQLWEMLFKLPSLWYSVRSEYKAEEQKTQCESGLHFVTSKAQ